MKVAWEESDINVGRVVCAKYATDSNASLDYAMTTAMKIGWITPPDGDKQYVLISMLDGMVTCPFANKSEVAEHLTKTNAIPMPSHLLGMGITKTRDMQEYGAMR